jgi:hypothetical protein
MNWSAIFILANHRGADLRSAGWRGLWPRVDSETPPTGRSETYPTKRKMRIAVNWWPKLFNPGQQWFLILSLAVVSPAWGAENAAKTKTRGKSPEDFFPLAVWMQDPAKAKTYQAAGINTYVGLWQGPTEDQLNQLKQAGMRVVCHQNEIGLKHLEDPTIVAWMHGDEPDNAQSRGARLGFGLPIPPETIVEDYLKIRTADPSRPVLLNLGQGVAWDGWYGRGERTGHPEDYPEYVKGCDIASFDIYPACHSSREVAGQLEFVARGVERLVQWTGGKKTVWNCIECTRVQHPTAKATPQQVRCEVWMSLIRGSRGIIYFVHEWKPVFNESALLHDPEMLQAVTAINGQITRLASVINAPEYPFALKLSMDNTKAALATTVRQYQGAFYLFACALRAEPTTAVFDLNEMKVQGTAEVLDENRQLELKAGTLRDRFEPWAVHLYRLKTSPTN